MCIRALDYLPPVDVTFFEYLRALITADFDLVSDDRHNYRVAFVEAFRRRGIYPLNLGAPTPDTPRTLSVDTLRWQGLDYSNFTRKVQAAIRQQYVDIVEGLKALRRRLPLPRTTARRCSRRRAGTGAMLHAQLKAAFQAVPQFAEQLGLDPADRFEVHELRRAMRISPDGRYIPQVVVALTQSTERAPGRHARATSSAAARRWWWTSRSPRSSTGSSRTSERQPPGAHRRLRPRRRGRPAARAVLLARAPRAVRGAARVWRGDRLLIASAGDR